MGFAVVAKDAGKQNFTDAELRQSILNTGDPYARLGAGCVGGGTACVAAAALPLGVGTAGVLAASAAGRLTLLGLGITADIQAASDGLPMGGGFAASEVKAGSFSIIDWKGYPSGVPQPTGLFRLLEGDEYDAARSAANAANREMRQDLSLVGKPVDVHEVKPVKFGGSPTDPANKVVLPRDLHRQEVTPWWNQMMRDIGGN